MAGTATVTVTRTVSGGVFKYSIAWTSDASGNVTGNAFAVHRGELVQAKFVPGAGGSQPTDLYDIVVVDTDAVDVLFGAGANLSNATASIKAPVVANNQRYVHDGVQNLDVQVSNAGNAKSGTVILWVR